MTLKPAADARHLRVHFLLASLLSAVVSIALLITFATMLSPRTSPTAIAVDVAPGTAPARATALQAWSDDAHASSYSVQPNVGLTWLSDTDPTISGVPAPQYQFLVGTSDNSFWFKSGAANTAWTRLGSGSGAAVDSTVPIIGNGSISAPISLQMSGNFRTSFSYLDLSTSVTMPGSLIEKDVYATKDLESVTGTNITWTPSSTASYVVLSCAAGTTIQNITAPSTSARMISGIISGANDCTFETGTGNVTSPGGGATLDLQAGDTFALTWIGDTQPLWTLSTTRLSGVAAGTSISLDNPNVSGGIKTISVALPGGTCSAGQFVYKVDSDGTAHCSASPAGGLFAPVMMTTPTQASTGLTTWFHQPSGATVADEQMGIVVQSPSMGGSLNLGLISRTAPTPPYSITALVDESTLGGTAIIFGWSDGTKIQAFQLQPESGIVYLANFPNATTLPANPTNKSVPVNYLWLKLVDDGTNVSLLFARDPFDPTAFTTLYTTPISSGYLAGAYNQIVFGTDAFSNAQSVGLLAWAQGTN